MRRSRPAHAACAGRRWPSSRPSWRSCRWVPSGVSCAGRSQSCSRLGSTWNRERPPRARRESEGLRMLKRWPLACLAAVVLAGCADEGPVGLDPLVPPGVVRSFEVILDADRFLVMDTSITGFTKPSGSGYGAVARAHGGVLDAHTLARFALPLRSVTYKDTAGVTRTDNAPIVIGAELILGIDTLQGRPSEPVSLALYRTGQ